MTTAPTHIVTLLGCDGSTAIGIAPTNDQLDFLRHLAAASGPGGCRPCLTVEAFDPTKHCPKCYRDGPDCYICEDDARNEAEYAAEIATRTKGAPA